MNKTPLGIHISSLAYDYIYAYDKVSEFFNGDFRKIEAFQLQTEMAISRHLKREELAEILSKQNREYGCGSHTCENIDRLVQDQACAVVTGQQVGLFSGPLYTIYKSLTAIKLAEYLNQTCRGRYVPVFWMASDDHDVAEIDHINVLNKDNRIEKIQFRTPSSNLKIPASKLLLTSEITDCIRLLEDLTHDSEFKPEILSHLRGAYKADQSFVVAFAEWMTRLFKSTGLIFMDASHPDLKELGKNVFSREIAENSPSTERALETSNKLELSGYHVQVHLKEGMLNQFFTEKERQAIQSNGDDFFVKGAEKTFKKSELLALLDRKPEIFSPNVLLRPIYQDALLPTVAYIGGPGEIAYFAQMKGVYEGFGLPMPVIYPRKTVTVIEKNVNTLLERYDLEFQDIWQDADRKIKEVSKKQIPVSIEEVFRSVSSHLGQEFQAIKQEIMAIDPTLEKSADLALRKMKFQLKFLEEKVLRAANKRSESVTQQLRKARNSLYPTDRLQERVFNIVPFLIKYGYGFLDKLYKSIDTENHDHQVIKL